MKPTAAESRYMGLVALCPCVVCVQLDQPSMPVEVHHVAKGSGLRSHFAVAPLCAEHHRGEAGLHGMGVKAFVRLYRVPGETEYGLLVWTAEQLEKLLWKAGQRIAA